MTTSHSSRPAIIQMRVFPEYTGDMLRALRVANGYTAPAAAEMFKCHPDTVLSIESRGDGVRKRHIAMYMKHLEYSASFIATDQMVPPRFVPVPFDTAHTWMRMARKLAGITQQNVADALGLSIHAYQKIESDALDVSVSQINTIVRALGFSELYLQVDSVNV